MRWSSTSSTCVLSAQVVELFHKGKRVASHRRSPLKGRHSTVAAHMPTAHQHYAEWTPQRLIHWAAHSGAATAQVVETILASRPHPQQGFRSCLGIMRLGKSYGDERLEAACQPGPHPRRLFLQEYRINPQKRPRPHPLPQTAQKPRLALPMQISVVPSTTVDDRGEP